MFQDGKYAVSFWTSRPWQIGFVVAARFVSPNGRARVVKVQAYSFQGYSAAAARVPRSDDNAIIR